MQQQHSDAMILRVKDSLAQLSDREITLLILNARREDIAYPLAVTTTEVILDLARQELMHRRQ